MEKKRFLDKFGLEHFFNLIKTGVIDAKTVNGHTVAKDVPSDAKFTDTTYSEATQSAAGLMGAEDKTKLNGIETGAEKNIVDSVKKYYGSAPGETTWTKQAQVDFFDAEQGEEDTVWLLSTEALGQPNGAASLDSNGKVPSTQLQDVSFKITNIYTKDDFVTGNESVEPNEKKKIVLNVSDVIPSGGWELAGIVGWSYGSKTSTVSSPTIEVLGARVSNVSPNFAFWAHNTSSSTETPAVVFAVLWKKS